jgi:hypothetical protein
MEKQNELENLKAEILSKEKEINRLTAKGLAVTKELALVSSNDAVNAQMAELNYTLLMAQKFIDSKAFPSMQPEQAYVLIKAGGEMGLQPMESMTSLCIINGGVSFHSKALAGRLTKMGYKIDFINETEKGVTCVISHENGFKETESITKDSPQLARSKAMTFAPKNKMRFHCIRQIANFHLAHLFGSVSVWEEEDLPLLKKNTEKSDLVELFELKKESLTESEVLEFSRIIENNEKGSYNKLSKILKSK